MKQIKHAGILWVPLLLASGCSTMSGTDTGLAAGGLAGAGAGAAIGAQSGHPLAGALIGGIAGAATGGIIGHEVDESERRKAVEVAYARAQLGITEVAQMARANVADEVIIAQIRSSGSVYRLSSTDTVWLKQNGVSDRVIEEMLASATRYPRPYYYYAEPVYYDPPPIGVGVGFVGRWR
jgi:surface antigen